MTTLTSPDIRKEARRRVEDREVVEIEREREERDLRARNEQVRVNTIADLEQGDSRDRSEREALLPEFVEALTSANELAVKLWDNKQRQVRRAHALSKLGAEPMQPPPRAFGRQPAERNLIVDALQNIGKIGGVV